MIRPISLSGNSAKEIELAFNRLIREISLTTKAPTLSYAPAPPVTGGEKGEKGDAGPAGSIGPRGQQGATGETGPAGGNWQRDDSTLSPAIAGDSLKLNGTVSVNEISSDGTLANASDDQLMTSEAIEEAIDSIKFIPQKDEFTLSSAQITAKAVTLSNTPRDSNTVIVIIDNAGSVVQGQDYVVSGSSINWDGKDLESILGEGDVMTVHYTIS